MLAQGQQNHVTEFLARHEVGTLAKALEVFIVSKQVQCFFFNK